MLNGFLAWDSRVGFPSVWTGKLDEKVRIIEIGCDRIHIVIGRHTNATLMHTEIFKVAKNINQTKTSTVHATLNNEVAP